MSISKKFTGKIQTWQPERGFGFILADDGKTKIFFHIKSLHSPHIEPKVGETVQVITEPDKKGLKAKVVSSPQRRALANQQAANPKVQVGTKTSVSLTQPNFQNQTLGKIVEWNDERGFGFIQTDNFKEKIFFHIKNLSLNQGKFRPQQGETVLFTAKLNKKGWTATSVTSEKRQQFEGVLQRRQEKHEANLNSKAIMALFISVIWLSLCAWRLLPLAMLYMILSLILFHLYQEDKKTAVRNSIWKWRTPEKHLHLCSLIGGWCGALVARYMFNHKSTKQKFVRTFWATVVINITATIFLMPYLTRWIK